MLCLKCKVGMKEMKRIYHKKRKWVCPVCGCVRMQQPKTKCKVRSPKYER